MYQKVSTDLNFVDREKNVGLRTEKYLPHGLRGKLQITLMQSLQKEKINRMKKKVMDTKLITQLYG